MTTVFYASFPIVIHGGVAVGFGRILKSQWFFVNILILSNKACLSMKKDCLFVILHINIVEFERSFATL